MTIKLTIVLHGSLSDFTRHLSRHDMQLNTPSTAKDILESLGPPHTEWAYLCFNEQPIDMNTLITEQGKLAAFSHDSLPEKVNRKLLIPGTPPKIRFLLDVHLGELARLLRLLGLDTLYTNHDPGDEALALQAAGEQRILLSRDIGIFKRKVVQYGYWLRHRHPQKQLAELFQRYPLQGLINSFSRCLKCNGELHQVDKALIANNLPEHVRLHHQHFWQCNTCHKVYWKGSHYKRLQHDLQLLGYTEKHTSS